MSDFNWTAESEQQLRTLWARGDLTRDIAGTIGCSKNAVVGKAHRLHLEPRPSPIKRATANKQPPPRRAPERRRVSRPGEIRITASAPPTPPRRRVVVAFTPDPALATESPTTKVCAYPLWTDATPKSARRYCGHPVDPGSSWCAPHAAQCCSKSSSAESAGGGA